MGYRGADVSGCGGARVSKMKRTVGQCDWTEEELGLRSIVIDKKVPIRERYPHGAFARIAEKMKVGDSVSSNDSRVINGLRNALAKLGRKTTTRTEIKNRRKDAIAGIRIWRIE